jgi:hypothetical protein
LDPPASDLNPRASDLDARDLISMLRT